MRSFVLRSIVVAEAPGGWRILIEPETGIGADALAPDLAGWRRERLPAVPASARATIAPDWVCEVLSRSTAAFDRGEKLDTYATWNVGDGWLLDPMTRTLEAYRLEAGCWVRIGGRSADAKVRVEPFEAQSSTSVRSRRSSPPRQARVNEKVAPWPGALSTQMRPP